MENENFIRDTYGHPCKKEIFTTKEGAYAIRYVRLSGLVAAVHLPDFNPKKQVLFKDGNGLNVDFDNLTQKWSEVNLQGKKKRLIALSGNRPVVFESVADCADYFGLNPLYLSQALCRGTNIDKRHIEYYFDTLDKPNIVRRSRSVGVDKPFKVYVGDINSIDVHYFHTYKQAAGYLGVKPSNLSVALKGRDWAKVKGQIVEKL